MASSISDIYMTLNAQPNQAQDRAIRTVEGPLRIVAGPGSGKTQTLVLRTLNLLCCEGVSPSEVVIVTFTDKAARELEDRIRTLASRLASPPRHLVELNVGTIHWFCGVVLRRYHPRFRRFEPLDALGQRLFIYRRLDEICKDLKVKTKYVGRWSSKARAVGELVRWFTKISEETITSDQLSETGSDFLAMIGTAYDRYCELLVDSGYLDFSLILRYLYEVLAQDATTVAGARAQYSHFLIDEYQDTNFVQEEILLQLAAPRYNIAVVGDDDQSLYRFRGATVRNLLEFSPRLNTLGAEVEEETLEINYRSHPEIIRVYSDFIADCDWTDGGQSFRIGHAVVPDPAKSFPDYPAAIFQQGLPADIANLVVDLIQQGAVSDPNQIALLFFSVARDGLETIEALRDRGVECYAPRAGRFLDHDEVRNVVGELWALGGFDDDDDSRPSGGPVADTCAWAVKCWHALRRHPESADLVSWLSQERSRLDALQPGEDMGASLLDLVYKSFRYEPFATALKDPIAARNLGQVSSLLQTFQHQFGFAVLHAGNRKLVPWRLWASFFYMLESEGVDEVEGEEPAPSGMVQVMTIHQAKGLEFPLVVVGSLARQARSQKEVDATLGPLYPRGPFEPESRVTEFDWRRLFYVGLSRAKHLVVAFSEGPPYRFFLA